jgi:predicted transcriptional regulator
MKTPWQKLVIAASLVAISLPCSALADDVKMNIPPGDYQKELGTKKVADPSGTSHTKAEVAGKVVVAIFTAPNMSQGDTQQKWADMLSTGPTTKVNDRVYLLLVEDMSQAGMFSGMARSSMKKEFTPDSRPFLVIDENGDVLKRFGVAKGRTQILIYDKHGKLRDVEADLKDTEKTDHRIKVITKELMAE